MSNFWLNRSHRRAIEFINRMIGIARLRMGCHELTAYGKHAEIGWFSYVRNKLVAADSDLEDVSPPDADVKQLIDDIDRLIEELNNFEVKQNED